MDNVSEALSIDNMKKTGLYGYENDFLVDCVITSVDDVLDIHKYLMKKHIKIAKNNV